MIRTWHVCPVCLRPSSSMSCVRQILTEPAAEVPKVWVDLGIADELLRCPCGGSWRWWELRGVRHEYEPPTRSILCGPEHPAPWTAGDKEEVHPMRVRCPLCSKYVRAKVPKGGDGTAVRLRSHHSGLPGRRRVCRGSLTLLQSWDEPVSSLRQGHGQGHREGQAPGRDIVPSPVSLPRPAHEEKA